MTSNSQFLGPTLRLYDDAEKLLRTITRTSNFLRTTSLVLSVLTTGSLWLVLTKAIPAVTLWAGAIASTVATFITLYLKSAGASKRHAKILVIHGDIAKLLAKVRADKAEPGEFWDTYKKLEHDLITVREALNESV